MQGALDVAGFDLLGSGCADMQFPRELHVALLRGFVCEEEVAAIHSVAASSGVTEIKDRDEELVYRHVAYRVESQLKKHHPRIFNHLLRAAHNLDSQLWCAIRPRDRLHPEIEYIVYDVAQLGRAGTITPHCDNASRVTMIVMLTDPSEFEGGVNCFEGESPENPRMVKLERGDAVFFNGEACLHWITPVTTGRRVILQMELSRGHFSVWRCCVPFIFMVLFIVMLLLPIMAGILCWQIWLSLPLVVAFECWLGFKFRHLHDHDFQTAHARSD